MELEYIRTNSNLFIPQKAGVKTEKGSLVNHHVCIIKKLLFGRWQIDYFDKWENINNGRGYRFGDEDVPNKRLILYPNGIEEISYIRNTPNRTNEN